MTQPPLYPIVSIVRRRIASVVVAWSRCSSWNSLAAAITKDMASPDSQYGILSLLAECLRIGPFFELQSLEAPSKSLASLIPKDLRSRAATEQRWIDKLHELSELIETLVSTLAISNVKPIFHALVVFLVELLRRAPMCAPVALSPILATLKAEFKVVCASFVGWIDIVFAFTHSLLITLWYHWDNVIFAIR